MNRDDLRMLATLRLSEARALLVAGHPRGAYYLSGYAVECGLKAIIAGQTQLHDFPDKQLATDSYIHDLTKLCRTARLESDLGSALRLNARFRRSWEYVTGWSENSRYVVYDEEAARSMIESVSDERDGVLPWIMQYW